MKRLLDMPVGEVFKAIDTLKVPQPITVQQGCYYLMFMESIGKVLAERDFDPNNILLEEILNEASAHGGYEEKDWTVLDGEAMVQAMLFNSEQGLFFTRLTYLTARLMVPNGDSHVSTEKQV